MTRTCALVALLWTTLPSVASANGAFPDSQQILLPADQPHEILLATNFGLVMSEDDGATWRYVCEEAVAPLAFLYQVGPAPADRLFALSQIGLVSSTDAACTWTVSQTPYVAANASDAFPDPTDPMHVLAIAPMPTDAGITTALWESKNGGMAFDAAPLFVSPQGAQLTGVEIARSAPQNLYLTMFGPLGLQHPYVLHSSNGGGAFQTFDEIAATSAPFYLAAVDPADPLKAYLRITTSPGESLGITDDGGMTLRIPLVFTGAAAMTCFLRRPDGTLLVGANDGRAYRSKDGGLTFPAWPNVPHLRALAERGGILYAAGSNVQDGFALASSVDEGASWQPLLRFSQIEGPTACVATICAQPFAVLKDTPGFADPLPDAGVPVDASMTPPQPKPTSGCGCTVGSQATDPNATVLLLLIVGLAILLSRTSVAHDRHACSASSSFTPAARRVV